MPKSLGLLEKAEGSYERAVEIFERAINVKSIEPDDEDFQEIVKRRLAEIKEQYEKARLRKPTK